MCTFLALPIAHSQSEFSYCPKITKSLPYMPTHSYSQCFKYSILVSDPMLTVTLYNGYLSRVILEGASLAQ